jgi:hypothetical protein
MAEVEVVKWNKTLTMTKPEIIRFQIIVHCHFQKLHISSADLDCLTLLGQKGSADLTAFCELLTQEDVFKSIQSSRNAITRLQDKKLILKEGRNKKKILLHSDIKLQRAGNVLVDIKCFSPQRELANQIGVV